MRSTLDLTASLLVSAILLFAFGFIASQASGRQPAGAGDTGVSTSSRQPVAGLSLEIVDVRNEQGNVLITVFDVEAAYESYDYELALAYRIVPAQPGTIRVHFPRLTNGPYAVSLFHDENGDYDLNFDGLNPLEGYGTSGASDPYYEPTFEQASVWPGQVTVEMHYLR